MLGMVMSGGRREGVGKVDARCTWSASSLP